MLYRHKKSGGLYRLLLTATRESDLRQLAIYVALKDGSLWARTLDEFDERFSIVGDTTPDSPPALRKQWGALAAFCR